MLRRLSISTLIIAGAFTLAQADVYRWVDDKGQPHYSDQWMPGSEVIKTSKAHPTRLGHCDTRCVPGEPDRIQQQDCRAGR
jgi:hypothetical protein